MISSKVFRRCAVAFSVMSLLSFPAYGKHKTMIGKSPIDSKGLVLVDIGAFSQQSKSSRCSAYMTPDSSCVKILCIRPAYYTPNTGKKWTMYLEYTPTLIDSLTAVSRKYREWTEIAKANYTGKFTKPIPVLIPFIGHDDQQTVDFLYRFTFPDEDEKYFMFNVWSDTKVPSLLLYVLNYNDPYIPRESKMVFSNCDEFDAFIEFLRFENIQRRIRTATIDNLFK